MRNPQVANKHLVRVMPQRSFQVRKIEAADLRSFAALDLSPTDRRALARFGHEKGIWDRVDWFVRFSRIDLVRASEGELLMIQEEFVALLKAYFLAILHPPSLDEMVEVQQSVQKHLSELADEGSTIMPEVSVSQMIVYTHRRARFVRSREPITLPDGFLAEPTKFPKDCLSLSALAKPSFRSLVYLLGQLLVTVGNIISRCPHCQNVFLQSRRNQEYCSRPCQSVAVMQRRRAEGKEKRKGTRNRRERHGAKRR